MNRSPWRRKPDEISTLSFNFLIRKKFRSKWAAHSTGIPKELTKMLLEQKISKKIHLQLNRKEKKIKIIANNWNS